MKEHSLGTDDKVIRKHFMDKYHAAGKRVIVSAFGATEHPTTLGKSAAVECAKVA